MFKKYQPTTFTYTHYLCNLILLLIKIRSSHMYTNNQKGLLLKLQHNESFHSIILRF